MTEILDFLVEFEIWFYIILGLISLIFFSRLFKSINQWREAAFGLEREIAQRNFRASLSILMLIFMLILAEFFFVTYTSSVVPDMSQLPTPTLDMLASPQATTAPLVAVTEVIDPQQTATSEVDGCIPGEIEWIVPEPASEIESVVRLVGTVDIPNFGFYKYEYTEVGNPIWKTIAGGNQVKVEEELGLWNTTQLIPGDYLLRLVVLDNDNKEYPPCVVAVRVKNQ